VRQLPETGTVPKTVPVLFWIGKTMKEELKEVNAKLDKKADEIVEEGQTILGKLKDSPWTAAGLIGGSIILLAVIFK
jgi:hypothetical protein